MLVQMLVLNKVKSYKKNNFYEYFHNTKKSLLKFVNRDYILYNVKFLLKDYLTAVTASFSNSSLIFS